MPPYLPSNGLSCHSTVPPPGIVHFPSVGQKVWTPRADYNAHELARGVLHMGISKSLPNIAWAQRVLLVKVAYGFRP